MHWGWSGSIGWIDVTAKSRWRTEEYRCRPITRRWTDPPLTAIPKSYRSTVTRYFLRVARLIRYPPLPRFLPPPAHLIPSLYPEPATAGESWVNGNRSWCEFDSNRGGSRKTRFRRNGIHNRLETFSFDQIFDNSIEPISRNDYSLNIWMLIEFVKIESFIHRYANN